MKSTAKFHIDEVNHPIIELKVYKNSHDDLRDITAIRFIQGLDYFSNLCTVRSHGDWEDEKGFYTEWRMQPIPVTEFPRIISEMSERIASYNQSVSDDMKIDVKASSKKSQ